MSVKFVSSRRIALLVAFAALPVSAQNKDWKDELKAKLEAAYPPTLLGPRSLIARTRMGAVEREGIVLVVLKPGMLASGGEYGVIRQAVVRNGALTRTFQQADDRQYLLKPGDRVYVHSVHVDDDAIALRIMTVDPIERVVQGTTISDRYIVQVKFELEEASLPSTDIAALQEIIGEILTTEEQATAPKTIALGQTPAEVESVLGKPSTIIDLGARKTYVYPNMRVVFTDGMVSDVQ